MLLHKNNVVFYMGLLILAVPVGRTESQFPRQQSGGAIVPGKQARVREKGGRDSRDQLAQFPGRR